MLKSPPFLAADDFWKPLYSLYSYALIMKLLIQTWVNTTSLDNDFLHESAYLKRERIADLDPDRTYSIIYHAVHKSWPVTRCNPVFNSSYQLQKSEQVVITARSTS
jgi:hypothetical protein